MSRSGNNQSFERLAALLSQCEVHDVLFDYIELFTTRIPYSDIKRALGPYIRDGNVLRFGRRAQATLIKRKDAQWYWRLRIHAKACDAETLRAAHTELKDYYSSVREYEAVVELAAPSRAISDEISTLLDLHGHVPYNRTGIIHFETTAYSGPRKSRRKHTRYEATPKLTPADQTVIRFQMCLRVPHGKHVSLTEIADIAESREEIARILTENFRLIEYDVERMTDYYARSITGRTRATVPKAPSPNKAERKKQRQFRDPDEQRLLHAKWYANLVVQDVARITLPTAGDNFANEEQSITASFGACRLAAFWLENHDLPYPRSRDIAPLFWQKRILSRTPSLKDISDEDVYDLLAVAYEEGLNWATVYELATDCPPEPRIARKIQLKTRLWATSYKLHLIRDRKGVNRIVIDWDSAAGRKTSSRT